MCNSASDNNHFQRNKNSVLNFFKEYLSNKQNKYNHRHTRYNITLRDNIDFKIAFSKIYIALCSFVPEIYWPHQNKWALFTGRWPRQERLATSISTDAAEFYDTWLQSIQHTHQMMSRSLCPTKITLKTEGVAGMMPVVTQITMFQMLLTCG